MSVESQTHYYIRCDKCKGSAGKRVYESNEYRVVLNARERGWVTEDEQHLCPNCIHTAYLHLKYRSGSSE